MNILYFVQCIIKFALCIVLYLVLVSYVVVYLILLSFTVMSKRII